MTDEQKVKRKLLRAMKTITECMGILAGDCKDESWTAAHFPAYEHVNGKDYYSVNNERRNPHHVDATFRDGRE